MCRQAISIGTENVNVDLAFSIFDKQILTYGCSIWGLPKFTNYLYLDNLPENETPSTMARKLIKDTCNSDVKIDWVRKTKTPTECTGISVMIKFGKYEEKEKFIQKFREHSWNVSHRDVEWDNDGLPYEKSSYKPLQSFPKPE
jgi:hypothetical protein